MKYKLEKPSIVNDISTSLWIENDDKLNTDF